MDKCPYQGPYTLGDCTPDDPCAACERDNLRKIVTNFQKAFLWIETSWLKLTAEEESALKALKEAGEWPEDSSLFVVVEGTGRLT